MEEDHPNGRCKYALDQGGLNIRDDENMAVKVIGEIFSKLGAKLLTGNLMSLTNMSTPACIHSHKSYLDNLPYEVATLEYFAKKYMSEGMNPIEKI